MKLLAIVSFSMLTSFPALAFEKPVSNGSVEVFKAS